MIITTLIISVVYIIGLYESFQYVCKYIARDTAQDRLDLSDLFSVLVWPLTVPILLSMDFEKYIGGFGSKRIKQIRYKDGE